MPAAYAQVHFRLDFVMKANTMNPDQTAPKARGPYFLTYRVIGDLNTLIENSTLSHVWRD